MNNYQADPLFVSLLSRSFIKWYIACSQKYKCLSHFPYMTYLPGTHMEDVSAYYVPYLQVTTSFIWPGALYTYFTKISCYWHITEQTRLPHWKYRSHCPILIWAHSSKISAYMCYNTTKYYIHFTSYGHVCTRNEYACHTAHICHTFQGRIWGYMCTHEVLSINHKIKSTIHICCKLNFMLLPYISENLWLLLENIVLTLSPFCIGMLG